MAAEAREGRLLRQGRRPNQARRVWLLRLRDPLRDEPILLRRRARRSCHRPRLRRPAARQGHLRVRAPRLERRRRRRGRRGRCASPCRRRDGWLRIGFGEVGLVAHGSSFRASVVLACYYCGCPRGPGTGICLDEAPPPGRRISGACGARLDRGCGRGCGAGAHWAAVRDDRDSRTAGHGTTESRACSSPTATAA
jgi:hypothetical protein